MSNDTSRDALYSFLHWMEEKGLIPARTAGNRRGAAKKILGILDENEAADVLSIDIDHAVERFENLHRGKYSPSSLNTYKAAVAGALTDFRHYVNDPIGFKPTGRRRASPPKSSGSGSEEKNTIRRESRSPDTEPPSSPQSASMDDAGPSTSVIPIQIRSDAIVRVQGLPFDLSKGEARKIANIVLAHVLEDSEDT